MVNHALHPLTRTFHDWLFVYISALLVPHFFFDMSSSLTAVTKTNLCWYIKIAAFGLVLFILPKERFRILKFLKIQLKYLRRSLSLQVTGFSMRKKGKQRRALRIIFPNSSYQQALDQANLTSLADRRIFIYKKLMADMRNESHPISFLAPQVMTRSIAYQLRSGNSKTTTTMKRTKRANDSFPFRFSWFQLLL